MLIVWSGLALGAAFAVVAMGYNMTLIGANVMNFASPFILILGAYIGVATINAGLPLVATFLIVGGAGLAIGLFEEVVAIRLLQLGRHGELLTTFGFATAIEGVIVVVWGTAPLQVNLIDNQHVLTLFGGRFLPINLVLFLTAVGLCILLNIWTHRTRLGLASLARMEDEEAARLRAIDVRRMSLLSFGVSGALAAMVGIVVGASTSTNVSGIFQLAVIGFVALTIGGQRSYWGALGGGLAVGLIQTTAARWFGADAQELVIAGVFALVLLVAPQGIFGRAVGRRV